MVPRCEPWPALVCQVYTLSQARPVLRLHAYFIYARRRSSGQTLQHLRPIARSLNHLLFSSIAKSYCLLLRKSARNCSSVLPCRHPPPHKWPRRRLRRRPRRRAQARPRRRARGEGEQLQRARLRTASPAGNGKRDATVAGRTVCLSSFHYLPPLI